MKFLEDQGLARFNAYFQDLNVGDYIVHGGLEAYSCKLAGYDKKLSRSLESDVIQQLAMGSPEVHFSVSPVGPLTDSSSRKTLIYLILTLNHMFPDYDFSNLRAHHFTKERSATLVKNDIDSMLVETCKLWDEHGMPMTSALWGAIDEAIGLMDCDCYSYKAQVDADPFSEMGNLWSFTYFFYNKKLKRILCFSCHATSRTTNNSESDDEGHMAYDGNSDYDEVFDDMDL